MNSKPVFSKIAFLIVSSVLGVLLMPLIWVFLKSYVGIGDRYLPSIPAVFQAAADLRPGIFVHTYYSLSRLVIGFALGVVAGGALGIGIYRSPIFKNLGMPSIQALRSVPPIATVPFFLLWMGFSETGRYLMIVVGIGFNIAIATYQILGNIPEKYAIMFKSFDLEPRKQILIFSIPRVAENLLPTVRFSLSTAIGLVIVSELLGSQVGLGYLIQTSRSTFALHTIFLATLVLGIVSASADQIIHVLWRKVLFWQR